MAANTNGRNTAPAAPPDVPDPTMLNGDTTVFVQHLFHPRSDEETESLRAVEAEVRRKTFDYDIDEEWIRFYPWEKEQDASEAEWKAIAKEASQDGRPFNTVCTIFIDRTSLSDGKVLVCEVNHQTGEPHVYGRIKAALGPISAINSNLANMGLSESLQGESGEILYDQDSQ